MQKILAIALTCMPASGFAQTDTISIYFGEGSAILSEPSKHQIDSLLYYEKLRYNIKLGIIGYADQVGEVTANQKLSEMRALAVKNYLMLSGFRQNSIQTVTGAGEIQRDSANSAVAWPADRRADIIIGGIKLQEKGSKQLKPIILPVQKAMDVSLSKLDIKQLEPNQLFRTNILFHKGSSMILPQSDATLDSLYQLMKQNATLEIAIEGHICCRGDKPYIDKLSRQRAGLVYHFLVTKGIAASRMTYEGFGNTRPAVWPEVTPADQRRNRRVEVRILRK